MRWRIASLAFLLAVALAVPAVADNSQETGTVKLRQIGTMTVPGKKIDVFDIGWVDQKTQRYFLADRTNAEIDVFNGMTDKFIGSIPGFSGAKKVNGKMDYDASGPNGVVVYDDVAWAGDGDSTVKEASLQSMKVVAAVSTGGQQRCDELAYDPRDHVLACGNGDDKPPFAALISTTEHKLIAKAPFANATDGIEAPAYNLADGLFYFSIPELDHNPKKNGVALISPKGKLVKMLPVNDCHPAGIVFGPNQNFLLGCSADGHEGMPPVLVVMSARTGRRVAVIQGAGGADEVAYSSRNHQYYTASSGLSGVFVINALNNKVVQKIPSGGHAHSVAASDVGGKVFVPEGANSGCGCVRVFAPVM